MSKRKKRLEKKIASLEERVAEHERKRAEYTGEEVYIRPYWEGEIQDLIREKEKAIRLMGRKKKSK
ncbi:MAG: hypothetical protein FJY77_00655 [Candidatus Altiarchaeales archaeon]|nr:hypothetical protein [Candidatus Altiarchaeales archaeon]